MVNTVKEYVASCIYCICNKPSTQKPHSLLHTPEIPRGSWRSLSMELVTDLLSSAGHTGFLVILDRFNKTVELLCLI